MKARRLIARSSSYGPETLKAIGQAFDGAWAEVAHHFQSLSETEAARLRLANIVMVLAKQDGRDPEGLKALALQMMEVTYRRLRGPAQQALAETPPDSPSAT